MFLCVSERDSETVSEKGLGILYCYDRDKQNVPVFRPSENSESSGFSLFPFTRTDDGTHNIYF